MWEKLQNKEGYFVYRCNSGPWRKALDFTLCLQMLDKMNYVNWQRAGTYKLELLLSTEMGTFHISPLTYSNGRRQ